MPSGRTGTHTHKNAEGVMVYIGYVCSATQRVPNMCQLKCLSGSCTVTDGGSTLKLGGLISIQTDPPNSHREITLDTCQSSLLPMPHANPHSPCKAGLKGEGRGKRNSSDFRNEKAVRPEPLTGQNRTCKRDDPQGFTYVGHPGTGRRNAKPSYRPSAPG